MNATNCRIAMAVMRTTPASTAQRPGKQTGAPTRPSQSCRCHLHDWDGRVGAPVCLPGRCAVEAGVVRMTAIAILQLVAFIVVLVSLVKPLGAYMARVYEHKP